MYTCMTVMIEFQELDIWFLSSAAPSVACVRKWFPDHDERELIRNLNQKCRDSVKLADPVVIE